MSNEEINRKIAEACGWTNIHEEECSDKNCGTLRALVANPPNPLFRNILVPNYCGDLNAMAEAESLLNTTDNQFSKWCDYYDNLLAITTGTFDRNIEADCRSLLHATAHSRALAFLKTVAPKL